MSIRAKLIYYFVLIAIIPVVITAFLSFRKAEEAIKEKTFEHLETAAILKEGEINLWMNENVSFLKILQKLIQDEVSTYGSSHDAEGHKKVGTLLRDMLNNIQTLHPEFQEIFLLEADTGIIHLSTNESQVNEDKSNRDYYMKGREDIHIQSFYHSSPSGELTTIVSAPIINSKSEVTYVIAARLNMDLLNSVMLEAGGLGLFGETYLINKTSEAVTPLKNKNLKYSHGVYSEGIKNCLSGNNGEGVYKNYQDNPVIGAYRWLSEYEICVIAEIDQTEAFRDASLLKRTIFLIVALIMSAAVLTGLLVSFTFSKPINKLTNIAKSISEGDLHKKLDKKIIQEKNEIGLLAFTLQKMQEELKQNFSEMRSIIETMPSSLLLLRSDNTIELVNKTAEDLLGYKQHELIGKPFEELLVDINFLKHLSKGKKNKGLKHNDIKLIKKTGEKISVSISTAKLRVRKDFKGGLIIVIQDITELKKYAKKRIDGITPILNQISLGDFAASLNLPELDDEFTDLIVAINLMSNNLKELISENRDKTHEIENSKEKLSLSHKKLIKAKELIEKEKAKAEALLGSIGEGILAADKSGKVVMMNPAAEEMFGIPVSDALGKNFLECCEFLDEKGNHLNLNHNPIKNVIQKNRTIYLTTYHKKLTGRSVPLSTTFAPILHAEKAIGLVATFRDISKEKEIDQAKTEFVSLASHQLRTPLTAIKWILEELLRDNSLNKHQLEYLHDASKSNARMIGLVNDLLNVSRLETGTISVVSVKTNINDKITQVIKEAKPMCLAKKQNIDVKLPSSQTVIEVDPQLLRQVISNLISNAIKYSDDNTTIAIELKKNKTKIIISVSDQGIGVPKKLQSRLFQKFFRTSEAIKRSSSGSGLGLYIIKKVTEAMHGDITFKSTEGKGTTFSVSLPLKGPTKKGDVKKLIEHRVS